MSELRSASVGCIQLRLSADTKGTAVGLAFYRASLWNNQLSETAWQEPITAYVQIV